MLHSERSTVQIKGRLKSSAFFTSRTSRFTCASFPARFVLGEARLPCSLHPNYQCSLTTNLLLPSKLLCFFRRRLSPQPTLSPPYAKLAVLLPSNLLCFFRPAPCSPRFLLTGLISTTHHRPPHHPQHCPQARHNVTLTCDQDRAGLKRSIMAY